MDETKDNVAEEVATETEKTTENAVNEDTTKTEVSADTSKNAETAEALANRKYAEGAKKKEKEICNMFGVKSIDELKSLIESAPKKADYEALAAKNICSELDVRKDVRDDVIAIVKGSGNALTEDNIKAVLQKHPEWIASGNKSDKVTEIGNVGGADKPQSVSDLEIVRNLFK